ncbi:uncharacterized protein LOC131367889 [Hemibagrus wyckioides]|uniref:uncharacterized protein LOC131367889 n=1 Tax=Hemibagrus wyckioides TaxID=337641 RepID=UPI00266C101A|nr:uncharacterized protein LOC131367889 [Hemibagrus wyckioides]
MPPHMLTRRPFNQEVKGEQSRETRCNKERILQSAQQDITKETTSNRVVQDGNSTQTSAIVPVYVSTPTSREILVYALLDSQSDTSFILEEVADALDMETEQVKLKLSTMSSKGTIVPCKKLKGLQIRGLYSSKKITVPTVYTREFIPANRAHIPTPETARAWPHLEHLAEHIAPQMECEIGLLIGYNCPQALMPRDVVCGEESQPFAQRTDLGWSIVSYSDRYEHYGDAIGVDNKIIRRAIQRLMCLKRKFKRDQKYHAEYVNYMNDMISRGEAEKVPDEELNNKPVWYIPHHGVYHPQKPGKIRVIFDCSARFQDTSLNDHLLTGPELTNNLVGVLCRFRKGPIAIMCDVEQMFHQFHVRPADQDYLRFLWWENDDLESPPLVFRRKVHLFGAASSPGCANFGLKHVATSSQNQFNQNTVKFIQRNFYVDDGLVSVTSDAEAIQLVNEARELCATGKLRLHKFISNSKKVLDTIPDEECAESVKELDISLGEPLLERALGVRWCISSDDFQFRVTVKEHALTRRGVLSTVAFIYDPLGFVAPFILRGKLILHQR